jgi:AcrR family transcriptional regulator
LNDITEIENKAPAGATAAAPVGRREAGKHERRRRIVEAARALMRETGAAGLSMRALAARAGVSLATPYNLFGSRHAIVLAVLQDLREYQERFAARGSADPIERIFIALDLALEYYKNDPRFYKTLWGALFNTSDATLSNIFNPRRNAFWLGLIADAINAGAISKDIKREILLRQLDFILLSAMHGWVVGEIEQESLTPTAFCGFALVLAGASTPPWRRPLEVRVLDSQARMLDATAPEPQPADGLQAKAVTTPQTRSTPARRRRTIGPAGRG